MTKEQLQDRIREAGISGQPLSLRRFREITGISNREILRHFDSWSAACLEVGVTSGPSGAAALTPMPGISRERCIEELRRVANILGRSSLSLSDFRRNAEFSIRPVLRHFKTWTNAKAEAGLTPSPDHYAEIALAELASEFLGVVRELQRVPSLSQLVRRSSHGEYCFSRKFGGYDEFKRRVIAHLDGSLKIDAKSVRDALEAERQKLDASKNQPHPNLAREAPSHLHGRSLNFRAFAYAPTYENEVVAIFGAVAEELGFEIICNRPAFPDCEAQRKFPSQRQRYKKCLIEFELRSSDFVKHGHPVKGCDLIVCWEHDWPGCPIEVLELSREIRPLPGWR